MQPRARTDEQTRAEAKPRPEGTGLVLVGPPNVGKSVLFNALTGKYAVVSNYPGTTIELTRGRLKAGDEEADLTDTPGTYSLLAIGGEERVTQDLLLNDPPELVVNVLDAKSLERMLPLALQLRELGVPVIVVVNMIDEAEALGLQVDLDALSSWLGAPVVAAAAVTGRGVEEVRAAISTVLAKKGEASRGAGLSVPALDDLASARARGPFGEALGEVSDALAPIFGERAGAVASLLLQGDDDLAGRLPSEAAHAMALADAHRERIAERGEDPALEFGGHYHHVARRWAERNVRETKEPGRGLADKIHDLVVSPLTGVPILLLVLYFGLYGFVGVFGAGTVVDFLEDNVFGAFVNPWVDGRLAALLPGDDGWRYWLRELFGGTYGIVPLGITYAVAIVLPIVALFFLFFSALEDSGYFPRLALLVDGLFKRIGLNGRAVIPIVLGFACSTMATLVTRVQETRRERVITTFLLALAIPCSAQYGVMVAVLVGRGGSFAGVSLAFVAWASIVASVFLVAGLLASKLVPGERPAFYMELPPMRLPRPSHVLIKTIARMKWYFVEILPLFILASLLIWVGRLTGLFDLLVAALVPAAALLGLPGETAEVLLYGFFRRDLGAAGLFDLTGTGLLDTGQVLVAAVTLTLLMPCVAQVLVMLRERGPRVTATVIALVVSIAFTVGLLVRGAVALVGGLS